MLMIRLQRVGRRNHAEFRVVVTEKTRAAKSSNYKELVGHYNPHTNEASFDVERIKHWMGVGAQVSDTLHNLLVRDGVIKGEKKNVLPKKSPVVKEEKKDKEEAPKEGEETEEDAVKEAAEAAKDEPEEAPEEEAPAEEDKKEEEKPSSDEDTEEKKPSSEETTDDKEE